MAETRGLLKMHGQPHGKPGTCCAASSTTNMPASHQQILQQSYFMLILARLIDGRVQAATDLLSQPGFDHQAFLEFITQGKVRNFVTGVLGHHQVSQTFPPKYAKVLLDHWKQENERKEKLWSQQDQLLQQCASEDIPIVVLKGNVLGHLLYEDLRQRHQSDLDFLIKRDDLERALALLQAQGFLLARGRKHITANQLRCEHAITLERAEIKIDLHWCLRTAPAYTMDSESAWQHQRVVSINNREVSTISHEWALTLLLLSFAHDVGRGAGKLKHVIDICLLARACALETSWYPLWDARKLDGTLGPCINALAFVSELVGPGMLPSAARDTLKAHRKLVHIDGQGHCLFLLNEPRRSIQNALWFCRVYPLNIGRDARYALERIVTRPGRVPLLLSRIARRTWQITKHAFSKAFNRAPHYPTILPSAQTKTESRDQDLLAA